jgi:MFS family permease
MHAIEGPYAWRLAVVSMLCIAVGVGALYLPVVAMTQMAAEFGNQREIPSLAYTLAYIGTGVGGIAMGWLADRVGPRWTVLSAGVMIGLGCLLSAQGGEILLLVSYGVLVGLLGHAGTFTPLMNNIGGWFERRRGTALAVVAIGNALGGFSWPQIFRLTVPAWGWRDSMLAYGALAFAALVVMALYVRGPPPHPDHKDGVPKEDTSRLPFRSPVVMGLLAIAGLCCCTPMAMPVVHMVAFCTDLGFSPARGSDAVSMVQGIAVACALSMGRLADRIGALPTVAIGSGVQLLGLVGLLFVSDVPTLFLLTILLGIPFIAIVQAYALVLRDFYGARPAGWRLGFVMLFTLGGMALGGWLAGIIFDATASYIPAFKTGIAFNLVNLLAVGTLYLGWRRVAARRPAAVPA